MWDIWDRRHTRIGFGVKPEEECLCETLDMVRYKWWTVVNTAVNLRVP